MRNVAQDRTCWAGQAMLFQRCGMSVFGVFARESAAGGSALTGGRDWWGSALTGGRDW